MRFPEDVPTLVDGDLTLRAHHLDDAAGIVEQCRDPLSQQWTTVPLGYDHAMAVEWVTTSIPDKWESGTEQAFAIETVHRDGSRGFGGTISLRDEGERRAEIAFGAHPGIRGRGVMTRAANLLLDHAFGGGDLETVLWWANVGNLASRRVAWKTGFTFGGTVPRWLPQRGEYLDGWVGSLHRSDSREPKSRWLDVAVIEGEQVRLRPFRESDVARLIEASNDVRTQHWLAFLPRPSTAEHVREFIGRTRTAAAEGTRVTWAVADPVTDQCLGNISARMEGRSGWEIGYLGHPDARGRGVMRAACRLVTRHVLTGSDDGGLGATRVVIKAAAANTASQYVAIANGYTEYGRERRSEPLGDGSFSDIVAFDLLASEWEAKAS